MIPLVATYSAISIGTTVIAICTNLFKMFTITCSKGGPLTCYNRLWYRWNAMTCPYSQIKTNSFERRQPVCWTKVENTEPRFSGVFVRVANLQRRNTHSNYWPLIPCALTQARSLYGIRHAIPHATARAQKQLHQLDTTSVTPCFYDMLLGQQIQQ